jgi:[ribosomal protein S5]-alanine N-acetyltransferase
MIEALSFGDVPSLRTERLVLTLPGVEDAEELLAYAKRNREHLRPWSPPEPAGALTLEGTLTRIETIRRDFAAGTSGRFWLRGAETLEARSSAAPL